MSIEPDRIDLVAIMAAACDLIVTACYTEDAENTEVYRLRVGEHEFKQLRNRINEYRAKVDKLPLEMPPFRELEPKHSPWATSIFLDLCKNIVDQCEPKSRLEHDTAFPHWECPACDAKQEQTDRLMRHDDDCVVVQARTILENAKRQGVRI